ncbi:VWA domain-containing protein [Pontibacter sp. G13]|uniref:vWA domain-containing protein n=1 Tax=Pontibacter sp. G13 TaxID=3074898 RepID=UPI00288B6A0F|nr:VWA domain-containing protein [Pontibacter sp. G13]WNJ17363.1 VWA domain-containing protein [Pontibacter sp. G13]
MNDWISIDWQAFHFLRPKVLWALIGVAGIFLLLWIRHRRQEAWQMMISPALRPFMFSSQVAKRKVGPKWWWLIAMMTSVIALAGPTWLQVEKPGQQVEAVLLILLDVSPSMNVEDIQPARLERAKYKIRDLLDANPRAKAGLVAYAGTAHLVVPFTSDYPNLTYQLQSLTPRIMPVRGTNLGLALELTDSLMRNVDAPSTILIVSDGISAEDFESLKAFQDTTSDRIEYMAIATPTGGPVPWGRKGRFMDDPDGGQAIASMDPQRMMAVDQLEQVKVTTVTLDSTDVNELAEHIRANLTFSQKLKDQDSQWEDMGFYLVIPVVIICLFWFRKGWVVLSSVCGLMILSGCDGRVHVKDLFVSKDYQGQMLANEGEFEGAARTYEDPLRKGVAYYKAGQYDLAIEAFSRDTSAMAAYNLGLAYVQVGAYQQAMLSFGQAAAKDSSLAQQANQAQIALQTTMDSKKVKQPPGEDGHGGDPDEEFGVDGGESLSDDTQVDQLPDSKGRVTENSVTDIRMGKELEFPDQQQEMTAEVGKNILLRKVSDDPSEFMRKKFLYQARKHYSGIKTPRKAW